MALQAQFKTITSGGSNAYLVRGTDTEIQDFCASQGEYLRIDEESGLPLFFSKTVLPGDISDWHPLVKVQGGPRKGSYTLNSMALRFREAQVESIRSGVLQDKVATQIAQQGWSARVASSTANAVAALRALTVADETSETEAQVEPVEPQVEPVADPTADITDAAKGAPKAPKP
jgi:hypothetical protein